jgi:di/tricarboxylate transporter
VTAPQDGFHGGLMEHIHRAVVHGLGALRCYVTMLAAEGERRGRRILDQALWVLLLAGIGVVGVALFAFGAAQWIDNRLAAPGSGAMIVGMGLMVIFLAIALTRALRKERDS